MNSIYKPIPANFAKFNIFRWGKVVSLGFLLGTAGVMYSTFLTAYFNPDKSVHIYINRFGEANLELWLMGILLIISLLMVWFMLKEERDKIYATS